jgi:hypothetical protein
MSTLSLKQPKNGFYHRKHFFYVSARTLFIVKTCYLNPYCKKWPDFELGALKALEPRIPKMVWVWIGVQIKWLSGPGKLW